MSDARSTRRASNPPRNRSSNRSDRAAPGGRLVSGVDQHRSRCGDAPPMADQHQTGDRDQSGHDLTADKRRHAADGHRRHRRDHDQRKDRVVSTTVIQCPTGHRRGPRGMRDDVQRGAQRQRTTKRKTDPRQHRRRGERRRHKHPTGLDTPVLASEVDRQTETEHRQGKAAKRRSDPHRHGPAGNQDHPKAHSVVPHG